MNNLSWMIYLADVCGAINATLIFFWVLVALTSTALFFMRLDDDDDYGPPQAFKQVKITFVILGGLSLGIIAAPSSDTLYAIAASEVGETALNTETGGKAVKALNAWLDRQIDGEKSE